MYTLKDEKAREFREKIIQRMTPREIKAGQALTRELAKPGNFARVLDYGSNN